MKASSDVRWPCMRLDAMPTLSAALFSASVVALDSASTSGTTATVAPATRNTAANFSEKDAPLQAPPSHRTPRIIVYSVVASDQDEHRDRDGGGGKDRGKRDCIDGGGTKRASGQFARGWNRECGWRDDRRACTCR